MEDDDGLYAIFTLDTRNLHYKSMQKRHKYNNKRFNIKEAKWRNEQVHGRLMQRYGTKTTEEAPGPVHTIPKTKEELLREKRKEERAKRKALKKQLRAKAA